MRINFLTLAGWMLACTLAAQSDGSLDPTFNPNDAGYGTGHGIEGWSMSALPLPGGGILVGGYIQGYNCTPVHNLVRLHPDGRLDESFLPSPGFQVGAFAMRSDTIVAGGTTAQYLLRRILPDGTLVPTAIFPVGGNGPNGEVKHLKFLPDGRLAIAGAFTQYNGVARNRIAVANADGSLNTAFMPGAGPDGEVAAMAVDHAGGIIIGGDFSNYNGVPCNKVIRLNSDGGIDPGFSAGTINGAVLAIAIDTSGRILIGGRFTSVNGTERNHIARLHPDGSVDTSLDPGDGAEEDPEGGESDIRALAIYSDGKIAIAGAFLTYDNSPARGLARIFDNGEIDPTFSASGGLGLNDLDIDPAGNLILAGSWLDRLLPTGEKDPSFNPGTGVSGVASSGVDNIVVQSNGKVLISGSFSSYNGQRTLGGITRIMPDGEAVDPSFDAGSGFNYAVNKLLLDQDGKILAAGRFTTFNNASARCLIRLLPDGGIDPSFQPGTGTTGFSWLNALAIQPTDGKILAGGMFSSFNNEPRNSIVRLNHDGSLDTTFDAGSGPGSGNQYTTIEAIAIQPTNGQILVGGNFTTFAGAPRGRIARLNADGSVDSTFTPVGANLSVGVIRVLSSGKILIGGSFTNYNGIPCNGIARLHADGSLDETFDPGSGLFDIYGINVRDIIVQPDNSLLINGYFQTVDGIARPGLARLTADGELDQSFDPGGLMGCNTDHVGVSAIAQQGGDKLLIGGGFVGFAGTGRNCIARLYNDIGTEVEERGRDFFQLFPNPTTGLLTLALDGITGHAEAVMFDAQGRQMGTTIRLDDARRHTMDLSKEANGLYMLRIVSDAGVVTKHVFLQH